MLKRTIISGCGLILILLNVTDVKASIKSTTIEQLTVYTEVDLVAQKDHPMLVNGLKIVERSGLSHQVLSMPWNRAFKLAKSTNNSIIFPIYKTRQRADKFHWICPIAPSRSMYLFRLASRKDLHIPALKDINNKLVGVVKDSILHHYLAEQTDPIHFSLDATVYDSTNVNKLLKGRLDYVAQSEEQIVEFFEMNNLDPALIVKEMMIYEHSLFPMCAAINLNTSPQLIKTLNQAYQSVFAGNQFKPTPIKNGITVCH